MWATQPKDQPLNVSRTLGLSVDSAPAKCTPHNMLGRDTTPHAHPQARVFTNTAAHADARVDETASREENTNSLLQTATQIVDENCCETEEEEKEEEKKTASADHVKNKLPVGWKAVQNTL